ncbi:MAG: alkaline phosphatase family protein [Streptosporangiaceae bacterium]|nr:alkaline phosphatase family protein [Streptosporangiaceae bacterium]
MQAPRRVYVIATTLAMLALGAAGASAASAAGGKTVSPASEDTAHSSTATLSGAGARSSTATPIQHLVVIFDENVSFDHYFGTYPYAANRSGENPFHASSGTPTVNGLYNDVTASGPTGPLLTSNPNKSNPLRLGPQDPMTCDQDHGYTSEQSAADHGAEDLYVQNTGHSVTLAQCLAGLSDNGSAEPVPAGASSNYAVLDYYDGNTVTALWNYAQHYAMSDNAYGTNYGPSTPGAFNVTSAQTYGAICGPTSATINDSACAAPAGLNTSSPTSSDIKAGSAQSAGTGTTYSDADPTYDICTYLPSSDGGDGRSPASTLTMGGNNIGTELTSANVTWGWFEGGFDNGFVPGHGTPPTTAQVCAQQHKNVGGSTVTDYIPHHEPFEYYASTANPMHLPPTSVAAIGHTDQANHQYDLADFWASADSGNLPAVSFLKAAAYQDGHAGYSDPADEQTFLASTINHLESLPTWRSTAVVVTYDDSDGWYDHVLGPVITQSQTSLDTLTGTGQCGSQVSKVPVNSAGQPEQGKCGVGPRLPFLVISPWAKRNYVDNAMIDQSAVVKFIEQNWGVPAMGNGAADDAGGSINSLFNFRGPFNSALFLDPATGEPTHRL